MLDAFEGSDSEAFYRKELLVPVITLQEVRPISVKRYSNRRNSSMPLNGIKGRLVIRDVSEEVLTLLLGGELLHIGKNTSFGYGGYKVFGK